MNTPRPIPLEHLCPIAECGGRMKFAHSVPRRDGTTTKRRKCQFCGHEDAVILKTEIIKILEVEKRTVRGRTLSKKTSADSARTHTSSRESHRRNKSTRHNGK